MGGLLLLGLGLVMVLALRPARRAVEAVREGPPPEREPRASWSPPGPGTRTAERPEAQRGLTDNIEIESVTVDKDEVCKGDEVVVTVKAKSLDGEGEYLDYGVMGRPTVIGPRFSLRLDEPLGYGWMKVFVRGRMDGLVLAEVPPVRVRDCPPAPRVTIDLGRDAAMMDRAWLKAVVPSSSQPFEPVAYEWSFGDGSTEETSAASIEHSYEGRRQNAPRSYFFVTLRATDARGLTAQATRSIRFVNFGFLPLVTHGRVELFTGTRAAPTAGTPGAEQIWLYHGAPYTVAIERVTVKDMIAGADGRETLAAAREYGAAALLGVSELPPGKSVMLADLGYLRPPPGTRRVVEIAGTARGAGAADGKFSLTAPQNPLALGTAGDGQPSAEEKP